MGLVSECEAALAEIEVVRTGTERVLVACSGGSDSVALARLAVVLLGAPRVVLGHVDHGVRSGSADDAAFVASLGSAHGLEVLGRRLSPPSSDEATLRELRYQALESLCDEAGAAWILLGHTRDDQAETVLMRILRGGRVEGMPRRNGRRFRPLLQVGRAELRTYLEQKRWPFRDDPTNREPIYLRNRIRKELLPLLEARYRPGTTARLAALGGEAPVRPLARPPRPRRRPSSEGRLPGVRIQRRRWTAEDTEQLGPSEWAAFDVRDVDGLEVRPWRAGDRIRAFGRMSGRRTVADVLSRAAVPDSIRSAFPVVVDDRGRILWIPGLLRSELAPIRSDTVEAWVLRVCSNGSEAQGC